MIRRKIFVVGMKNGSSAIMLELFAFFSTAPLDFQIRLDHNLHHTAITLYSDQWNRWKSSKRHDEFKTMKSIKDLYNRVKILIIPLFNLFTDDVLATNIYMAPHSIQSITYKHNESKSSVFF